MTSYSKHIILGNGRFPTHEIPLQILKQAETIICCDGAVDSLLEYGLEPSIIIGDMDSISEHSRNAYAHCIIENSNQETNDQTKAVEWAISQGLPNVAILGATGYREDHTIGNTVLLIDYESDIDVCMVSNFGIFTPISSTHTFQSWLGQPVSLFCLTPDTSISSKHLKYPLNNLQLHSLWQGTLNESTHNEFTIEFETGKIIVFQAFAKK